MRPRDLSRRLAALERLNPGSALEPMSADLAKLLLIAAGHAGRVPDRFRVVPADVPHGADPEACRRLAWAADRVELAAAAGRRSEEMDAIRAECSAAREVPHAFSV